MFMQIPEGLHTEVVHRMSEPHMVRELRKSMCHCPPGLED